MSSNTDAVRKSTLATLAEIRANEVSLRAKGIDATDLGDWMELRDLVARIERRLAAKQPEPAQEAAELVRDPPIAESPISRLPSYSNILNRNEGIY